MLYSNPHAQLLLPTVQVPAADSAAAAHSGGCQTVSVCREAMHQIITSDYYICPDSAAAFAVVRYAPAIQPTPRAGRPQAPGVLIGLANRLAAARVQRWQDRLQAGHHSRFALSSELRGCAVSWAQ